MESKEKEKNGIDPLVKKTVNNCPVVLFENVNGKYNVISDVFKNKEELFSRFSEIVDLEDQEEGVEFYIAALYWHVNVKIPKQEIKISLN